MNYLGHLLLTYPHRELTMGNLLGDLIRAKEASTLRAPLYEGFLRHHEIDRSTDQHPAIRELIDLIRPVHGRYASVVVDILLDHVLARKWKDYAPVSYHEFTDWTYRLVHDFIPEVPDAHQLRLHRMVHHRWIDHYDKEENLYQVLMRMDNRASFESNFVHGLKDVRQYWDAFGENFDVFYRDMLGRSSLRNATKT